MEIIILDKRIKQPKLATPGSAGYDLQAAIDEMVVIPPGEVRLIPTGLAIHINNPGIAALILPRSKLGHKEGVILGNTVGLIDSDYQGQWYISVWNRNRDDIVSIEPLQKIAQVIFVPVINNINFNIVDEFSGVTQREDGGISKDKDTILHNKD